MRLWGTEDISFDLVDDMTDDPVVTIRVLTPIGPLTFMAESVVSGTTMILRRLHARIRSRMPLAREI
jgi:hypothetical protein